MKQQYAGYYDFLKDEIRKFKGDFDDYIFYIPDFFNLLCNLLDDDRLDKLDRLKISGALAYFVVPNDVIPEEIYGPAGYIDDIFLCCYVLNDLEKKYGKNFLVEYWRGDEDIIEVLDYSFKKSSKIIKEKGLKDEILKYVGLE